jgi:hypothetical protein
MRRVALCGGFAMAVSWPALGQVEDGIAASDILPDEAFFLLATCGTPPGEQCDDPILRWGKAELTVAVLPPDRPPPAGFTKKLTDALDQAIDEINAAGSGLTLRKVPEQWADIRISASDLPEGTVAEDIPGFTAPGVMGVGYMSYWSDEESRIVSASILISTSISDEDMPSVVLEELYQSLGPRFDVDGPAYEGVSILSQTSNLTLTIEGQDERLLHWLYPPKE